MSYNMLRIPGWKQCMVAENNLPSSTKLGADRPCSCSNIPAANGGYCGRAFPPFFWSLGPLIFRPGMPGFMVQTIILKSNEKKSFIALIDSELEPRVTRINKSPGNSARSSLHVFPHDRAPISRRRPRSPNQSGGYLSPSED